VFVQRSTEGIILRHPPDPKIGDVFDDLPPKQVKGLVSRPYGGRRLGGCVFLRASITVLPHDDDGRCERLRSTLNHGALK
jgi:hypothetical protein